ncbi:polysaccharide lyase family 8 super-sandwich domain-containing protein [Paenibacillus sp. PL2-23]|uniref:polysaccharide lyase family 8 super-sandwich domain-containing protein n=1 Tax=Paenibacillus sp. PL2-23 TaxID=2100729 RepID=UPI0030F84849
MFDKLLARWRSVLTGGSELAFEPSDPDFRDKLERIAEAARAHAQAMDTGSLDAMWQDVPKLPNAADLHENYSRLLEMALAHETPGSPLYQDEALGRNVLLGLEWMYAHRYNERTATYGNWWYWEIGSPLLLTNTLCLMRERLPQERLAAYLEPIARFIPNPYLMRTADLAEPYTSTGANRVWKCRAYLFRALLLEDARGIAEARDALSPVFELAASGDGFYADGSFIQHKKFSYTGGYGKSLLKELAELAYILRGTHWEMATEHTHTMVEWLDQAFDPFIFRGLMMDMVRGREISRSFPDSHSGGQTIIGAALQLAEVVSAQRSAWLKGKAKRWMLDNTCRNMVAEAPLAIAVLARAVLRDDKVKPAEEAALCRVYARMDRAVARGKGYAVAVSMFSGRTGSYESINGENLKGWYTAHGMTYLYNADLTQFSDGFWATVDPNRLPGTTVSHMPRDKGFGLGRSIAGEFVGGAADGAQYGLVGMELLEPGEFHARKSWFMLGDVIAAVGTVLEGSQVPVVETIVDNRKLNREGNNRIVAETEEGCEELIGDGDVRTLRPRWMHLSGNVPGADMGYVFPRAATLKLLREERSGRWSDISAKGSDETLTQHYMTAWLEHDTREKEDAYAYLLLPGRSPGQVAAYADNPDLEVAALTRDIHAVSDASKGLFAVHFWEGGWKKAGVLSCDSRASILLKESEELLELFIADPTQTEEGSIELKLHLAVDAVESCSESITVIGLQPAVCLSVKREGLKGTTQRVVFRKINPVKI